MREIKFRGKCIRTGKWVYGYLCSPKAIKLPNGSRLAIDPKSVGQYIGKEDKDGTEIYEGSFVEVNMGSYRIRSEMFFDYRGACILDGLTFKCIRNDTDIKVIAEEVPNA